ncbi:MAG: SMP-30/gluconolactonase/LRE family protein [Chloroflexaceae bacterium]|nr:SMP-30/gluconolactonase/LRE family protein [Chloroflexaceae bacterium]
MEYQTTLLVDGLKFPESPRWHTNRLWFSDYATRQIKSTDLAGNVHVVWEAEDLPTALAWTPDGHMLFVAANQRRLLRLEANGPVTVADLSGMVAHACGEIVVDQQGRAYVGNLGFDFGSEPPDPAPGSILLITPDGNAQIVATGLAFPNGMAITPDGQTLLVAESYAARLSAFAIADDGSLGPRRTWAQFDDTLSFADGRFTPDGLCLDSTGAVWVAALQEVLRIQEGGTVTERITLATFALACMLGGPARCTLFVLTTSSLNPADPTANGCIEYTEVAHPGAGWP